MAKPKSMGKAKKQRGSDEDEEEENDEEEDEDFHAEAEKADNKKKRRNVFVDAAAEEDGEEVIGTSVVYTNPVAIHTRHSAEVPAYWCSRDSTGHDAHWIYACGLPCFSATCVWHCFQCISYHAADQKCWCPPTDLWSWDSSSPLTSLSPRTMRMRRMAAGALRNASNVPASWTTSPQWTRTTRMRRKRWARPQSLLLPPTRESALPHRTLSRPGLQPMSACKADRAKQLLGGRSPSGRALSPRSSLHTSGASTNKSPLPRQDDVDDLIHDEGEEVPEAEDVARRYDREANLRKQAGPAAAQQPWPHDPPSRRLHAVHPCCACTWPGSCGSQSSASRPRPGHCMQALQSVRENEALGACSVKVCGHACAWQHEELDAEQLEAYVKERFGQRGGEAAFAGVETAGDGAPAGAPAATCRPCSVLRPCRPSVLALLRVATMSDAVTAPKQSRYMKVLDALPCTCSRLG